ncbi:similar to heparan sulfate sulfotransferase [Ectocarpus siliculosus]|uniref:Similar to heparan sulfate sulfotransferase n=1 Tax=Ectocarpus siliculosus TaxID=2880 RepID=D7G3W5_ECTSI|nr:similar to heparan sulfate sulfotransferase [Ectocarpus siliculosus]|eukprot:CBJ33642.1 similar to heparan sulfate sulfotransferase [Ectocarpus siliculosus]
MTRHQPRNPGISTRQRRCCWPYATCAAAAGTLAALCVCFVLGASIGWWLGGHRSRQEAVLAETLRRRGNKPVVVVRDAGESFVRHYNSFAAYAAEMLNSTEPLPVPVVTPNDGRRPPMSLPLGTIIGVQKGGTQNLRSHLLQHPLLSGVPGTEAHFFDRNPDTYPSLGEWPGNTGDARRAKLPASAAGEVLELYSNATMRTIGAPDELEEAGVTVTVDSSPMYIFYPLAPYRMKMVQPHARLVVILKDPTARKIAVFLRGFSDRKRQPNQLERWFAVFPRSQILVIDSSELYRDFLPTLERAARHLGLPPHDFYYDSDFQHGTGACKDNRPQFFGEDGRYKKMLEQEQLFRDWYRPHNERLYSLIGKDLKWD